MVDDIVVITGAGGFIGSNLVRALAVENVRIVACDRFDYADSWRYLAPYLVHDVIGPEQLLPWLRDKSDNVRAIVHMGAISATTETDVRRIIANNIRLTLDLWDYSAMHDKVFVYASSAATYGDGSAGFTDDDTPAGLASLRPLNLYGWSKHASDRRIIDDNARGEPTPTRWCGLKFFNVYGPNEAHKGPMRSVVHQLYPTAVQGGTVRLFKSDNPDYRDGGQLRDFVYVKDCCEIVRRALTATTLSGIYNAGTGRARTFEDLARAVFSAVGREPHIEFTDMPENLRGKYQYFTQADTRRLAGAGLAPDFSSLEAGVADYVHTHLAGELSESN